MNPFGRHLGSLCDTGSRQPTALFFLLLSAAWHRAGRLHGNLRAENDFFHVVTILAGVQTLVLDSALRSSLFLEQAQCSPS